jgi:hypothetical protein
VHPGSFTARYVTGRRPLPVDLPYLAGLDLATGKAQVADLPAPAVEVVSDRVVGDRHELTLRITPRRPVRLVALDLDTAGGRVTSARVLGTDVGRTALGRDRLRITYAGPPPGGIEALIMVTGGRALTLRVTDGSDGLDGLPGYTPRPPGVQAAGSHSSDLVLVTATVPLP